MFDNSYLRFHVIFSEFLTHQKINLTYITGSSNQFLLRNLLFVCQSNFKYKKHVTNQGSEKCMEIVIVTEFCTENILEFKKTGFVVSGIGFWILK